MSATGTAVTDGSSVTFDDPPPDNNNGGAGRAAGFGRGAYLLGRGRGGRGDAGH